MYFLKCCYRRMLTFASFGLLVGYIFLVIWPLGLWYSLASGRLAKRKAALHRHISRFFRIYMSHFVWGVTPEVRNPYHEEFHRPALIIANHQSILDLSATLMLCDRMVAMTAQWVWDSRLYGHVVRFADFFPASMPLDQMIEHLRGCMDRGYSVLIFPEGTRSDDCQVHKFRRGAFCLAEQLQCDVIPVTLWGTGRALSRSKFCLNPGRVIIDIGRRVRFDEGVMGTDHGSMTRYWHRWFVERYQQLDSEMAQPS